MKCVNCGEQFTEFGREQMLCQDCLIELAKENGGRVETCDVCGKVYIADKDDLYTMCDECLAEQVN